MNASLLSGMFLCVLIVFNSSSSEFPLKGTGDTCAVVLILQLPVC